MVDRPTSIVARWGKDAPLSIAATGIILFVPAMLLPLVGADELGNRRISQLLTGVGALWDDHMHVLSLVIFLTGTVLPLTFLVTLILLYGPESWSRPWIDRRCLEGIGRFLRTWAFPEVQVLAVIVGVIKLHALVDLEIDAGFWCYCGMTASIILIRRGFESTSPEPTSPREARWFDRLLSKDRARSMALGIASIILLAPANLLPVLNTETSGDNRTDTIFSGAMALGQQGLWSLAAIVFTASILIPGLKLIGLTILLTKSRQGRGASADPRSTRNLERLYAVLAFIGRWSMLDVFLAGFLVGLIEFGEFATVRAQDGLIAFAGVVVLTVLATESFDTRELRSG